MEQGMGAAAAPAAPIVLVRATNRERPIEGDQSRATNRERPIESDQSRATNRPRLRVATATVGLSSRHRAKLGEGSGVPTEWPAGPLLPIRQIPRSLRSFGMTAPLSRPRLVA